MKDQIPNSISLEEQMLRAMSMSIYGKQVASRCRVLTPAQKGELEAVGRQIPEGQIRTDKENNAAADSGQNM